MGRFTAGSRAIPGASGLALALALAAATGGVEAREPKLEPDFGHYSEQLVRCSVSGPGQQGDLQNCGRLRLEQKVKGVMTARFSLSGAGERYGSADLVFAGVLSDDSEPMQCRDDGRCRPRFPLAFRVTVIASGAYDQRGLAASLPRAWTARGLCRIEAMRASCEASGDDGRRWRAEGVFRSAQRTQAFQR
ncbi:MAG: hypothetical protein ACKO7Z_07495 [Cyanobacteriota bacterium]